jgi:catechol 2,3-dioxygenase
MSAGGYHHHIATNVWSPGPVAAAHEARLLAWELMVPSPADVDAAAQNLREEGYSVDKTGNGVSAADPWGTRVQIRSEH